MHYSITIYCALYRILFFECPRETHTPYMNMPYIFSVQWLVMFKQKLRLQKNVTSHNLDPHIHTGSTVLLDRVVVLNSSYQK